MKRYVVPLIALLLLWYVPALARSESVGLSDVVKALESPFRAGPGEGISDFEAEFFQESRLESLDRVQRGRGEVSIKFDQRTDSRTSGAKFRWEYEQPTNQEIVSDGRTLWVYLPENRQVIQSDISAVNAQRANDPVTFLTGLGNLSRDFLISWASPNQDIEGNYVLELRPRRPSPMIQRLLMVVDRDAVRPGGQGTVFPILSTTVFDPSGNTTLIEFSNARVNRGLSDLLFDFVLPGGVEVVRPTGQEMGF